MISTLRIFTFIALLMSHSLKAQDASAKWWEEYQGDEATGSHVLGLWKFDGPDDAFLKDSSSHNHSSILRGAISNRAGKFGACLESSAGYPVADQSRSIHVKLSSLLSPGRPFTVEMWIRPKEVKDFPVEMQPMLLDSKYVPTNHTGFQLSLSRAASDGGRRLMVIMGLGDRSESWTSNYPVMLDPAKWHHIAFTYDGVGTVAFFANGSELGAVEKPGAGPLAPAVRALAIGDRLGSNYRGFPGFMDEVRITSGIREFRPVSFQSLRARPVFLRMGEDAALRGNLLNLTGDALSGVKVRLTMPDDSEQNYDIPNILPGGQHVLEVPINSRLRPGEYTVAASFEVPNWGGSETGYRTQSEIPFVIKSRPLPNQMPVVMWGLGGTDGVVKEIPRLKELGFTHCLGLSCNFQKVWDEKSEALPQTPDLVRKGRDMLDIALENDLQVISSLSPGRWLRTAKVGQPYLRIDRKGNHYGREDVSGSFSEVQDFCFHTGAAMGRAWGDHPAYGGALLHTEVRGESQVSFHPKDRAAYRKATGLEIPDEVKIKNGVEYKKLPNFPENRVISDEDPVLKYLSWFWRKGDGWNEMNTRLHNGLKSEIDRDSFWTFHDPACRVPSISGSGGNADVLAHWTYSYPDPIRIGLCTDELFEMARVNGLEQDVMKMTQVIWYRSQTAPIKASAADPSPWVDRDPDAAYITIAPMQMREAFWSKVARPIKGIMYHGWQSLVKTESTGAYRYTNANAADELRRLTSDIVKPYGPMLTQIPDSKSDVVFLESFTSQMFARRGTYGWNHTWAGDLYHILMYAQLQPRVLYEESLRKSGLEGAKVLVMADCDVLTESVVEKIKAFQKGGGLVVGDGEVCPAIEPDYLIPRFNRTKQAKEDREALLEAAQKLRDWLAPRYDYYLSSTDPNVVTRRRKYGSTEYLFAINDRREFGNYVGNYGLVMEDGLPSQTTLQVNRSSGYVYEIPTRTRMDSVVIKGGAMEIPVSLGPCEGRIYMITENQIGKVLVEAPKTAKLNQSIELKILVADRKGKAVNAVIPLQVTINDPEGRPAEFSGYYGAAGGVLTIPIHVAPNDRPGTWHIRARELASGKQGDGYFRVE